MNLPNSISDQAINQVIAEHPAIGEILQKYDIGCVTCGVGICLVKDVVAIHALGDQIEAQIELEINDYLNTSNQNQGAAASTLALVDVPVPKSAPSNARKPPWKLMPAVGSRSCASGQSSCIWCRRKNVPLEIAVIGVDGTRKA